MAKIKKKTKWIFIVIILLLITCIWISNLIVEIKTQKFVYNDLNKIPFNKTGLLLGTSKFNRKGLPNEYFYNRITATVELYNSGKINAVVISGDNSKPDYNEPLDMKKALISKGIPEQKIYLDYAGFRTYDSVIRMWKIFGQNNFTIISQEFHNERAIFIARRLGLNAIGYNAKEVTAYFGFKTKVRELFARVKVIIDLKLNKQPKFMGNNIEIK